MATITEGVDFDTVAREWRFKWSADNDKKSLAEAQKALNEILAEIKAVDGFKKVDRVVCGGCLDFKVSNTKIPRRTTAIKVHGCLHPALDIRLNSNGFLLCFISKSIIQF
jgi:hypothetical protein